VLLTVDQVERPLEHVVSHPLLQTLENEGKDKAVAAATNPSNQLEQQLLSDHAHLAVVVDAKSKDVVQCLFRQGLQHKEIFQPHLGLPLEGNPLQVNPWQMLLATHQLVLPVQLFPLVLLQVVTDLVLVAAIAEEQCIKNAEYRRVRVGVVREVGSHLILHLAHDARHSRPDPLLAARELELHLRKPAKVGGEDRLPGTIHLGLCQLRNSHHNSVDKLERPLQILFTEVQLSCGKGSQLRHHRIEVAVEETGHNCKFLRTRPIP